jgi:tetraacyldisaccharide 4'-kinase
MADRATLFHDLISGRRGGPVGYAGRAALWWARLPYGLGVGVRNRLFDAGLRRVVRLPVPVVCVGNLSLGGTGKTPMVEWVARQLVELGRRPAVVSRGYGGDEARVLEDNLPDVPHLCGPDRAAVAQTAVEELEADCIVLDDGFQHRRLHRDLDIVLIDATRPPHDDYLFPRGTLREPASGIKRAGMVVLTRCDQVDPLPIRDWLRQRCPRLAVAESVHAPLGLVASDGSALDYETRGRPVALVSGIGNPASFRHTARSLGAHDIHDERVFPDHHAYTREDVADLRRWAAGLPDSALILTTQKDMVKLRLDELAGRPFAAARVGIAFRSGDHLLLNKLRLAIGDLEGVPT